MDGHPKTASEYVRIVEQAPDELDDILEAASYDFDEVEYNPGFSEALNQELAEIRETHGKRFAVYSTVLPDQPDPQAGLDTSGS